MSGKSNFCDVREFTAGASGTKCPRIPERMNLDEVAIIDECMREDLEAEQIREERRNDIAYWGVHIWRS